MESFGEWINGEWLKTLEKEGMRPGGGVLVLTWDQATDARRAGMHVPLRLTRLFRAIALRFARENASVIRWVQTDDGLVLLVGLPEPIDPYEQEEEMTRLLFALRAAAFEAFSVSRRARKLRSKDRITGGATSVKPPLTSSDSGQTARFWASAVMSAIWQAWRMALSSSSRSFEIFDCRKQTGLSGNGERFGARYAPIVSLLDGSLFGFEALPYDKTTGEDWTPEQFFFLSESEDELYDNDKRFRELAIRGIPPGYGAVKLLIPIPAWVVFDPRLNPGSTLNRIESAGLRPEHVILMLIDDGARHPGTLLAALRHYRMQGFRIGLSSVQTDRAAIERMVQLRPDYARINGHWIPRESRDPVGENLLHALTSLARKEKIVLIADNVEREDQAQPLMAAGIGYGQGSWIGRPSPAPAAVASSVTGRIRQEMRLRFRGSAGSLAELVEPALTFPSVTPVSEMARQFDAHREANGFVIVKDGKPVGLVMQDKLHRMLASQFGLPLYGSRPVTKIMDAQPLVVEETTPVDQLSQIAMAREPDKLYDAVIVTRDGQVTGIISIRSLLEWITNVRMADAQWANPLTGLPGNQPIRRELSRRLDEGRPFSVLYADLDHFKWYNDQYGFHRGDDVIRFTGDTLQAVVNNYCPEDSFIGHIGGDDFIVMIDCGNPVRIAEEALNRFEKGISSFSDSAHGPVRDRAGNPVDRTGVSLSLALLLCSDTEGWTPERLAERSALLKRKAKMRIGNALEWETLNSDTVIGKMV